MNPRKHIYRNSKKDLDTADSLFQATRKNHNRSGDAIESVLFFTLSLFTFRLEDFMERFLVTCSSEESLPPPRDHDGFFGGGSAKIHSISEKIEGSLIFPQMDFGIGINCCSDFLPG